MLYIPNSLIFLVNPNINSIFFLDFHLVIPLRYNRINIRLLFLYPQELASDPDFIPILNSANTNRSKELNEVFKTHPK